MRPLLPQSLSARLVPCVGNRISALRTVPWVRSCLCAIRSATDGVGSVLAQHGRHAPPTAHANVIRNRLRLHACFEWQPLAFEPHMSGHTPARSTHSCLVRDGCYLVVLGLHVAFPRRCCAGGLEALG